MAGAREVVLPADAFFDVFFLDAGVELALHDLTCGLSRAVRCLVRRLLRGRGGARRGVAGGV